MKNEERYSYIFVDMEWNQKAGTNDVINREPLQIGIIGTDENMGSIQLFSKNIKIEDPSTLTKTTCEISHTNEKAALQARLVNEVFEKVKQTFAKYQYVVVWNRETYELFMYTMDKCGIQAPKHTVIVLQELINTIVSSNKESISFEMALDKSEVFYKKEYLHYSKHDVKYLHSLYKTLCEKYTDTMKEIDFVVNDNSKILHRPDCWYAKNRPIDRKKGDLLLKGYRPCKCCTEKEFWKRICWKEEIKKEEAVDWRRLPLTESNIARMCEKYNMEYHIVSGDLIFISTGRGQWRIHMENGKVKELQHANLRVKKCEYRNQKWGEGYHRQEIKSNVLYEVLRYIYQHDKTIYKKKSRLERLFEQVEREQRA